MQFLWTLFFRYFLPLKLKKDKKNKKLTHFVKIRAKLLKIALGLIIR
jgi:hypothetical protein